MTDIASLIARLEAATGPDRELDAMIGAACALVDDFDPACLIAPLFYVGDDRGWIHIYTGKIDPGVRHHKFSRAARLFTSSLDAALTLIPDRMWDHLIAFKCGIGCYAFIKAPDLTIWESGLYEKSGPIAFCIAALKARAA